jgi:hypothetical protein
MSRADIEARARGFACAIAASDIRALHDGTPLPSQLAQRRRRTVARLFYRHDASANQRMAECRVAERMSRIDLII